MTVKPHTHSRKKRYSLFCVCRVWLSFFLFLLSPLLYSSSFTGGGRRGHFSFGFFFFFLLRVCGKSERVLFLSSRTVNTLLGTASLLLLLLLHFRCGVFGHPIPSSSSAHTNLFLAPPKKPCRGHLSVGMSPYSVCSALGLPHEKAGLD